jgi:hypothetical protein
LITLSFEEKEERRGRKNIDDGIIDKTKKMEERKLEIESRVIPTHVFALDFGFFIFGRRVPFFVITTS